jgi:peptidoglycan/LPS O-acetylase OafA/YrhL
LKGREPSPSKPVDRECFGFVQLLRGIAASRVVRFHASEGHHIDRLKAPIPAWAHPVFDAGNNGVAIFFALSGFVIAHSLCRDRITLGYLGRFALGRSIRLNPALWASIVLFVGLAALSSFVKPSPSRLHRQR